MENNESSGKKSPLVDSASVKWIVLGVVVLTALFLFKDELKSFIRESEEIGISSSGITLKKTKTILGESAVSVATVEAKNAKQDGVSGNSFTSREHKFAIDWPARSWYPDLESGKYYLGQIGNPPGLMMPIFIMSETAIQNFKPNVNVVVENSNISKVRDYVELSNKQLVSQGSEIESVDVDEETNSALVVMYSNYNGQQLYQFQRIVVKQGKAYVITATGLPPVDLLNQSVKEELNSILNSFRLIS
jgi:hypothetical protein